MFCSRPQANQHFKRIQRGRLLVLQALLVHRDLLRLLPTTLRRGANSCEDRPSGHADHELRGRQSILRLQMAPVAQHPTPPTTLFRRALALFPRTWSPTATVEIGKGQGLPHAGSSKRQTMMTRWSNLRL